MDTMEESKMEQINVKLLKRLERPEKKVDVVLDTDAYNEVDDQYALSYLIRSEDKLNLKAIYAAPFYNHKSESPADGMEKSYPEIIHLLKLLDKKEYEKHVYRGSDRYLPDEKTPVRSDAAQHLAALAMEYTPEDPLYVIAIGAITNVASAFLLNPKITERIVVIWLGGNAYHWPDNREFNCEQDVAAARVTFDSRAALVQLPCMGVVSAFTTTQGELEYFLKGKNELCNYLLAITIENGKHDSSYLTWSRVIWDVTAVAWLLNASFMQDCLVPAPIVQYDHHYSFNQNRHLIKYVYHINRDALFADLFSKLAR